MTNPAESAETWDTEADHKLAEWARKSLAATKKLHETYCTPQLGEDPAEVKWRFGITSNGYELYKGPYLEVPDDPDAEGLVEVALLHARGLPELAARINALEAKAAALVFTENEMRRYAGLLGAEVSKHKQTQAALDGYERLVAPLPDEQKAIVEAAMAFIKHEADMLRRATKAEAALDAVAAERDKAWRDLSSCAAEYEMYGSPEVWQNRYLTTQAALDDALKALANLDSYLDFTVEFIAGPDGGANFDNVDGINAALKQAHQVLAQAEAQQGAQA